MHEERWVQRVTRENVLPLSKLWNLFRKDFMVHDQFDRLFRGVCSFCEPLEPNLPQMEGIGKWRWAGGFGECSRGTALLCDRVSDLGPGGDHRCRPRVTTLIPGWTLSPVAEPGAGNWGSCVDKADL